MNTFASASKAAGGGAAENAAAQTGDTRDRILRATLRVIGEHGVEAVSNRRLAKEAGVALGSLTYHFPSQTELLRESLLLYVNDEVARLNEIAAVLRESQPNVETVAAEVERLASGELGPEAVAELELHLQASRDPALQEASARCFAAYDDVAAAALQALGIPDAESNARIVVALISGMAIRRLGTGQTDATGLATALVTLFRGVQAAAE
ncbi:MAG: TetR family transcriptional regulator [Actinobacteria bacterium]|nr:TetR family transcriptional regulator [Actinomycetota bacterium]